METRTTAEHERAAFGEFLRQARERRRLTLEQIAGETKIAPRLLTSLEQGNVQPMPKGMYRRAMLRAYAESVGLDTQAALSEFERTFEEPPPREAPLPTLPLPASEQQGAATPGLRKRAIGVWIAGLVIATAVGLSVWWGLRSGTERIESVATSAQVPPRPSPVQTQNTPPTPAALAQPAAAATSGTHQPTTVTRVPTAPPDPPLATEGRLVVISEPAGARVTVNGIGWGATPVTINYLPLGEKRVRLTMTGYISEERTVRIDGRRPNATVRLTLRERP